MITKSVTSYMSKMGARGGRAGKGEAKRRPPEACAEGGKKSGAARRLKKQQALEASRLRASDPSSQEPEADPSQSSPQSAHTD